jgi:preprotein translocase subunit SecG
MSKSRNVFGIKLRFCLFFTIVHQHSHTSFNTDLRVTVTLSDYGVAHKMARFTALVINLVLIFAILLAIVNFDNRKLFHFIFYYNFSPPQL